MIVTRNKRERDLGNEREKNILQIGSECMAKFVYKRTETDCEYKVQTLREWNANAWHLSKHSNISTIVNVKQTYCKNQIIVFAIGDTGWVAE